MNKHFVRLGMVGLALLTLSTAANAGPWPVPIASVPEPSTLGLLGLGLAVLGLIKRKK